jgi:hypothetical protein
MIIKIYLDDLERFLERALIPSGFEELLERDAMIVVVRLGV